ncbi:D-alanyl-D-alanine carboxypeptidase family protein (plasmid) [Acaryochloris sp. 'Moss Beach']|uniref:M15 family metallopeptidase n=1 Tax=Acaryochloris sp. 'Moss Beach' TaxID=2740837 RepID=UPI001F3484C7|nr:M15 family metallopeptidase [Acaryochloris sp. 'Moss Beach']UJB73465.1 D-alanyl-D-alanine carboxypeptidase family protein [Acaryochloris sp. 'Moss Beach']
MLTAKPEINSLGPLAKSSYLFSRVEKLKISEEDIIKSCTLTSYGINSYRKLTSKDASLSEDELLEYPGPNTPNFDDLHPTAQTLFRQADEAYWNARAGSRQRHLQIESGFRTVYRQAELFICRQLGEPGCNPADIPGASIHNSALAIDVRNARNEEVINALDNNGWDRTVMPGEPWHWECVGTAEHTAAARRRQEMRAPGSIARQWQSQWTSARRKNDQRNSKIDDFNLRLEIWQPEWDQLTREIEDFERVVEQHNSRVDQWNRDRDAFNQRVNRYNTEVEALQALRERIEEMEPSEERNRLIEEYNRRAEAAVAEGEELSRQEGDLIARQSQLTREGEDISRRNADLERRFNRLNSEGEALLRLRDEIETLRQEIESHLERASRLLDEIAQLVHP